MRGGHEPFVHEHRAEQRPEARTRAAAIGTGHDTDGGVGQRCHDARQVIRRDPHIAVRDDQVVMAYQRHHVHQIADFAAAAPLGGVDRQLQVEPGKLALQPVHDRDRRVLRVAHPENDLETRIALLAEGAQRFIELVFGAAQRLQNGDSWLKGWHGRGAAPRVAHGDQRDDRVDSR